MHSLCDRSAVTSHTQSRGPVAFLPLYDTVYKTSLRVVGMLFLIKLTVQGRAHENYLGHLLFIQRWKMFTSGV